MFLVTLQRMSHKTYNLVIIAVSSINYYSNLIYEGVGCHLTRFRKLI